MNRALDSLKAENVPWAVFQHVTPNPKNYEVEAGVGFYRDNGCDIIIAVGGGSPMDCAKGIGIVHSNEEISWNHARGYPPARRQRIQRSMHGHQPP